jgi:Fic family protein
MKKYNWQQSDWPHFRYDLSGMQEILLAIAEKTGFISGKLTHLTESLHTEAMMNRMVEEAIKTSEIEGEHLNRPDVRSSIQNKLGLNPKKVPVHDKRAQGLVALMFDVRETFKKPLTKAKLLDWHAMLLSGYPKSNIRVGGWRTHKEPMQIISGHYEKRILHYEAPPSHDVPGEMKTFIRWFNHTAPGRPAAIPCAPVRAAIAHLYFESIHPFEDGNGRIGRAIAEKSLSQGFGYPVILSLSQIIEAEKKAYYAALHAASRSNEITAWIRYFVNVLLKAQNEVEVQIDFILKKSAWFDAYENVLNERQSKVIKRMMEEGPDGFEGGMSAKKYMAITGTSKATATRDLQQLQEIKVFQQRGSGRSVRYALDLDQAH